MNTQKCYNLFSELRDKEDQLEKVQRDLRSHQLGGDITDGSFIRLIDIDLSGDITNLYEQLKEFMEGEHRLVDYNTFVKEDVWYDLSEKDFRGDTTHQLEVKSFRKNTPEENESILNNLLDKEKQLITMCTDLKEQLKEMVNV